MSRSKNIFPGAKNKNDILVIFQIPGNCQMRHFRAMAPWRCLLICLGMENKGAVLTWSSFLLWPRSKLQVLPKRALGGQFDSRVEVWICICSRMDTKFPWLCIVCPWRGSSFCRVTSREPQGWQMPSGSLSEELGRRASLARPTSAGPTYHSGQGHDTSPAPLYPPTLVSLLALGTDHTPSAHLNG